ncbi:MAG: pseudouridine synthase, partial [Coriobacteriia bacterium]|nr:pseudouridine synthase [Coriobacteriia bacterium]
QAVTTFRVLERFMAGTHDDGYTLIECKLYTGRTHQIRVHMAYINHACVGDQTYGAGRIKADRGLMRQFLHSYRIAFDHPVSGEHIEIIDTLPADLDRVLSQIEPDSMGRTQVGEEIFRLIASGGA